MRLGPGNTYWAEARHLLEKYAGESAEHSGVVFMVTS